MVQASTVIGQIMAMRSPAVRCNTPGSWAPRLKRRTGMVFVLGMPYSTHGAQNRSERFILILASFPPADHHVHHPHPAATALGVDVVLGEVESGHRVRRAWPRHVDQG